MRARCRYIELNYHAMQYPGDALMRNVKYRSKENLSLVDMKTGLPVGAPTYFLVLIFLFFSLYIELNIGISMFVS